LAVKSDFDLGTPDGRTRRRRIAMGDPQAPFDKVLAILDGQGLLGDEGLLRPDVELVSVGDHFDWGPREVRSQAREDGLRLLAWLAAHPPDQVTILVGNHDLARVGELHHFDEAFFARAQDEADALYFDNLSPGQHDALRGQEASFRDRYALPSAEVLARDFAAWSVEQRDLVAAMLRRGRFVAARAPSPTLLLTHAGVTQDDLDAVGVPRGASALDAAHALNEALARAVAGWDGTSAFAIPGVHRPGNSIEEGRGIFFHRPSNPEGREHLRAELFAGPPRRRFDPRRIPKFSQAVGHVGDSKCRELLEAWCEGPPVRAGQIRQLETDGRDVRYVAGVFTPAEGSGVVVFLDGGMARAPTDAYELWDLESGLPVSTRA
jgi:hypothetical protein